MITVRMPRGCRPPPFVALYADARQRVLRSPRLREYRHIIMDDCWAGDEDHLRWVFRGRVGEIERWARQIKRGCGDD